MTYIVGQFLSQSRIIVSMLSKLVSELCNIALLCFFKRAKKAEHVFDFSNLQKISIFQQCK